MRQKDDGFADIFRLGFQPRGNGDIPMQFGTYAVADSADGLFCTLLPAVLLGVILPPAPQTTFPKRGSATALFTLLWTVIFLGVPLPGSLRLLSVGRLYHSPSAQLKSQLPP